VSGSNFIEQVKVAAAIELPNLAEQAGYRWPARTNRQNRKLHCPFHADKTASAHLYDDRIHCFSCGRSSDAIDLEQLAQGGTVADAIRSLAARHGIEAGRGTVPFHPRFDTQTLAEAELFRIGLSWHVERELEAAKLPLLEIPGEVDGARIRALTQMLAAIQAWGEYDAAEAFTDLKVKQPNFVAGLIAEATEVQTLLVAVINQLAVLAEVVR
jgi:hypothetical protein